MINESHNTAMAELCARLEQDALGLNWHCPSVDAYQAEWNGITLYVSLSHARLGELALPNLRALLTLAREATAANILGATDGADRRAGGISYPGHYMRAIMDACHADTPHQAALTVCGLRATVGLGLAAWLEAVDCGEVTLVVAAKPPEPAS